LIIYDSEDAEIIIVERVAKVRVITEKVAQLDDFEERHGEVIESELVPAAKRRRCRGVRRTRPPERHLPARK
jgi:hypothetical protein